MRTTLTDSDSRSSTYAPISTDASSSRKQLRATRRAMTTRAASSMSVVFSRNTGAPPSGLTMGSRLAMASSAASVNWRVSAIIVGACRDRRQVALH